MRPFFIWVAIALIIGLIGVNEFVLNPPSQSGTTSTVTGKTSIGGPFTLVNHNGETVTDKTYAGRLKLIFFGFTNCPDICPTDLGIMSTVMEELGDKADQVVPLFITVDPERDDPKVIAEYLKDFSPRIIGLTGNRAQIDAALEAYKVYASKREMPEWMDGYMMNHSAFTYLMDGNNEYLKHFEHDTKPEVMVAGIRKYLK